MSTHVTLGQLDITQQRTGEKTGSGGEEWRSSFFLVIKFCKIMVSLFILIGGATIFV
jgi:hypothetical protein